jgi:hypothetical protein
MAKRTGKSKPPSPKGELIQIRVTPEQKAEWQAAAVEDKRKLSDWLRLAAESYMETRKVGERR